MQFGICTTIDQSAAAKAAGWDYIEESVQGLLQGELPDAQWDGLDRARQSALPIPTANLLVPAHLKITGPDVDPEKLRAYLQMVLNRAQQIGMKTLVFGSGGARHVPPGFDRGKAWDQIAAFAKVGAEIAKGHGVTIVLEPLNATECNIVNSVQEAMTYVRGVDHPNFKCLVDSYHFWLEDESLEHLVSAMPSIGHVHVADKVGRVAPGESGQSDYAPFFRVIKQAGYDGLISVEAAQMDDMARTRVLGFLKDQWNNA